MKSQVPFQQVDVFTAEPYKGNPVAVIMNGDELSDESMQQIANWTHLSETTFVCRPHDDQADYRLRIFTPHSELPFAGHPTIGSAWTILQSGIEPKHNGYLVQECGEGLVKITIKNDELFLTLPTAKQTDVSDGLLKQIADGLRINVNEVLLSTTIDVGAIWITLQLENAAQVVNLKPDFSMLKDIIPSGVTGVTILGASQDHDTDFEVRSFAPNEGVDEDPICGSGNGCAAVMVKNHHLINQTKYVASQGRCLGRNGQIKIDLDQDGQILVGGNAVTCIEGQIRTK